MLLISGTSGLLETLPILASLPLIRSLFLGEPIIHLMGINLKLWPYSFGLFLLLISRFVLGSLNHWYTARHRTNLITQYRIAYPEASKVDVQRQQKRVQTLHFLLNGFSQLLPGLVFTTVGAALLPLLGAIIIGLMTLWWLPLRWLKRKQDAAHRELSQSIAVELKDRDYWLNWYKKKAASGWWDGVNKNSREFVVLSTLIFALLIAQQEHILQSNASFIAVFMFLRGLQHLFNAYIMSQQVSALKSFLPTSK